MAAGDSTYDPTYMSGMSGPTNMTRPSTRLRNAARRLSRSGHRAQAGELMLEASRARLNEPTYMTQGFRKSQQQGQRVVNATRRSFFDDTLDFERDVAPMRQTFFQDLERRGLSADDQGKLARRFMPLFEEEMFGRQNRANQLRKDDIAFEKAQLDLQNMRKGAKRQREVEGILPNIVDQINPIINSATTSSEQIAALSALKLKHPTAITDPRLSAVFATAYTQVAGHREDEKVSARNRFDTAISAARTGAVDVVKEFYKPDDAIGRDLGALARAVNSGTKSKAELANAEEAILQKQKGLEFYLGQLETAGKEVNSSMTAFAKGSDDTVLPSATTGTPPVSTHDFRKMQFVRVARVLRDVIGQERFDKTPFADVNLDKIGSDALIKQFSALLRQTRDAISDKRDEVSGRRYNTLSDTEAQAPTGRHEELLRSKFGL